MSLLHVTVDPKPRSLEPMARTRAWCRVLGSVIGAVDVAVAIVLLQDHSLLANQMIEATVLVVLFAAIAGWLLMVE